MKPHWPTVADPGLLCSCGWRVSGVTFPVATERWWQHVMDALDFGEATA